MPSFTRLTPDILKRLDSISEGCLASDAASLERCSRDASTEVHAPEAVFLPSCVEHIQKLLRLAHEHCFPVVPRGGGTGLAGGALAVQGGVVLDLSRMDRILSIEPDNMLAVVEPGVLTADLRRAVAGQGLFYPPDPASLKESTIGGNVATNAGGPACVKYGTTGHYVLGLEAVLPDGTILNTGTRTRKGVVGLDLTRLLVGSEGTLAVISKIVLKLVPRPRAVRGLTAVFPDLACAMLAVSGVMTSGVTPSAVEFMDAPCLDLVRDLLPLTDLPSGSTLLLVECDGLPVQAQEELDIVGRLCRHHGALAVLPARDDQDREKLWEVRRQVSLRIHERWTVYVPEDVALPLGSIASFVQELPELEKRYGFTVYAFGHAGDGNIHINITAGQEHDPGLLEAGTRELLRRVVSMGGTISGEHGIGLAKKRFLDLEIQPPSLALQQGVKKLFDPRLILNPGKVF